jgi:hypothetical protein
MACVLGTHYFINNYMNWGVKLHLFKDLVFEI